LQPAESVKPFVEFDTETAKKWAEANAMATPPAGIDACTWFASQELKAGGLPQDSTWNLNFEGVNRNGVRYGTDAAWIAPKLTEYLNTLPYVEVIPLGHMNAGNNNLPKAKPGDLIAYVWHGDNLPTGIESLGNVEHISVIVGNAPNNPQYPLVAEWGRNKPTPYPTRGWTYSMKSKGWLEDEDGQHNMFAYLIHIRTEGDI
jgi:hypothetical protein